MLYGLVALLGKRSAGVLLICAALFLGAARMTSALIRPKIEARYGVQISGTIRGEPLLQEDKDRLVCRLTGVRIDDEPLNADIRLYLREGASSLQGVQAGQNVRVRGMLWEPDVAKNPGEFDFAAFLWKNGMAAYATAKVSDAEISSGSSGLSAFLCKARERVASRIDSLFARNSGIVKALILGTREDLSDEISEDFSRAGIAHLLAISGLHVSLIAMLANWILHFFLSRRISFWITLLLVVFYGILSGLRASVLRAILMFAVLGGGALLGRPSDAPTRIAAAFLILLVANPLYLTDAGFVLSFSASAGLIFLSPPMERLLCLPEISQKRFFGRCLHRALSMISATMCAQLATLPSLILYFGEIPLLSFATNLLAVPLTMFALFLAVPALFIPFLGVPIAWIVDLLLDGLVRLSGLGANLPFSALRLMQFPALLAAIFVGLIFAVSDLSRISRKTREWMLLGLPLLACIAALLGRASVAGLTISFLEAGNADAAVLCAQGETYLIDAGLEQTPAASFLESRNLQPNAIFLSHPDEDHAGGLLQVLQTAPPQCIYVPVGWYTHMEEDGLVRQAFAQAEEMGIPIVELSQGDRVQLSAKVTATVLYPSRDTQAANSNALSMLLLVEYGEGAALFTGDLSIAQEPESLPDVDVLKIAHHGSNTSTSFRLIEETSPSVAVISCGENSYGHPSEEVIDRLEDFGAQIWRTDHSGAVTVRIFQNGWVHAGGFCGGEE